MANGKDDHNHQNIFGDTKFIKKNAALLLLHWWWTLFFCCFCLYHKINLQDAKREKRETKQVPRCSFLKSNIVSFMVGWLDAGLVM